MECYTVRIRPSPPRPRFLARSQGLRKHQGRFPRVRREQQTCLCRIHLPFVGYRKRCERDDHFRLPCGCHGACGSDVNQIPKESKLHRVTEEHRCVGVLVRGLLVRGRHHERWCTVVRGVDRYGPHFEIYSSVMYKLIPILQTNQGGRGSYLCILGLLLLELLSTKSFMLDARDPSPARLWKARPRKMWPTGRQLAIPYSKPWVHTSEFLRERHDRSHLVSLHLPNDTWRPWNWPRV